MDEANLSKHYGNAENEPGPVPAKVRKRRASGPRKKPAPRGRKTLVVAACAAVIALADLFLVVRMGIRIL